MFVEISSCNVYKKNRYFMELNEIVWNNLKYQCYMTVNMLPVAFTFPKITLLLFDREYELIEQNAIGAVLLLLLLRNRLHYNWTLAKIVPLYYLQRCVYIICCFLKSSYIIYQFIWGIWHPFDTMAGENTCRFFSFFF